MNYAIYNDFDSVLVDEGSATVRGGPYLVPTSTATVSRDFYYIIYNDTVHYISVHASGTFQLIDGYGFFEI